MMVDVSLKTCFVFIKNLKKKKLPKHCVVHQPIKKIYIITIIIFFKQPDLPHLPCLSNLTELETHLITKQLSNPQVHHLICFSVF